jgi:hypothetical protein
MHFCLQLKLRTLVIAGIAVFSLRAENLPLESHKVAVVVPRFVSVVHADARTGRLVRSIVVASKPVPSRVVTSQLVDIEAPAPVAAPDSAVRTLVEETAKTFDVSPALVDSVIQVESNYNPYAVSPKGAQGLMQLMPATARRFGVKNSFDAKQNIEGGVRYLKFLQQTFKGDDRLAIAAYNAGEGAVTKYGNVPPYAETMNYVAKVGKKYGQAKRAADKPKVLAKLEEPSKPSPDEPRHIVHYLDSDGRMHIATR